MRRITAWAAAGLLCLGGLAACGDSDNGSAGGSSSDDSKEPLKIGFAMGFTGATNAYDGPVFAGAQLAVEDFNAKGGIDGRKIEIVKGDTKSELSSVASAALSVLEEGAEVVVTSCDYDFGGPSAREANKQGKFAIGCAGDPLYGKQGIGPLTFNTLHTTPLEAGFMAAVAQEQGVKSAYLLADTTIQYSKRGCSYAEQALKDSGIRIAGKNTFQNTDNSIAPQVARMKAANADAIILCSYLPGATSAVRQIRAGGIDAPIIGQAGVDGRMIANGVPKLSDLYYGTIGSIHSDSDNPKLKELGERYDKMTDGGLKNVQDYAPILGYATIETIAKAIEGAGGSTDGAEMAKVVEGFDSEELVSGPTTYSSECHTPINRPMRAAKVENGKVETLEQIEPINVPKAPC